MKHAAVPATLTLLALASAISTAYAQDAAQPPAAAASSASKSPDQLERTIITGTRTAKAIDKIPGAVDIVTKADLDRSLALTEDATAVLSRTVPGYSESTQAMANAGETLRGRIPLRLFDGVPQGSPLRDGSRNATFSDLGVIGRIEVINGPSASEGIGAAGGIINYISKTPTKFGDEFTWTTKVATQGKDDSTDYKVGGTFARKNDAFDLLIAASYADRGIAYDGKGYAIGPNTSGSVNDSKSKDFFLKVGTDFGTDHSQRLQFSASKFTITGKGNYYLVDGDRTTGVPNTAGKGNPFGGLTEFNNFEQYILSYRNDDLAGGSFTADAYFARQFMRFPAENSDDKQDPLISPLGTLVDQSEITARKKGLRTSWTHEDFASLKGLEFRVGVDLIDDIAQQRLALTDRIWVPPMDYSSVAPYLQLQYETGPLTLSGGVRREQGKLEVNTYTTTYYRNRELVEGGSLKYDANLWNIGAVMKLPADWSAYAALSRGFSLPNIGIPLRNINTPGQTVEGFVDLQAIIAKNKEVGVNWRGRNASFGASLYQSDSNFGASLVVDPVTTDYILNRAPVRIRGLELSGDMAVTEAVKGTAVYSRIIGHTTFTAGGPMDRVMGVNDISPDKLNLSATWKFLPQADVTLGTSTFMTRHINVGTGSEENTKGYTLFDLSGNYDFGRYGKLAVGVENLFDRFYFLSSSQVIGYRNYWSGRGRVVSVSHTISF